MDEINVKYRDLLQLLENEYQEIGAALDYEHMQDYRQILKEEMEMLQKYMQFFYNN